MFTLTVVALAIAVMVGDGCCAFVSMALGRSEIGKAKRSVGNAVVLSVAGGLILTVVYLVFADSIIAMFGGTVNEETCLLYTSTFPAGSAPPGSARALPPRAGR